VPKRDQVRIYVSRALGKPCPEGACSRNCHWRPCNPHNIGHAVPRQTPGRPYQGNKVLSLQLKQHRLLELLHAPPQTVLSRAPAMSSLQTQLQSRPAVTGQVDCVCCRQCHGMPAVAMSPSQTCRVPHPKQQLAGSTQNSCNVSCPITAAHARLITAQARCHQSASKKAAKRQT